MIQRLRQVLSGRGTYVTLTIIATVIGAVHSYSLAFVNDDAFISFRYARNLVAGLGLVFNPAERVEGYTNFLWTILIAAGMKFGFDPVPFSIGLGITFSAATILLTGFLSWRARGSGTALLIPLAAIGLSLHRDFNVYATSGLESSMFAFLVLSGLTGLSLFADSRILISFSGLAMVLAIMTRPDGFLFWIVATGYIIASAWRKPGRAALFILPFIVLYVPYWCWRYSYYGFPFPNAFYAKSISLPYYDQGLIYAWLFLKTYYIFFLPALIGCGLLWKFRGMFWSRLKHLWTAMTEDRLSVLARVTILSLSFVIIYTIFIVRIGGDFMFARFFVPIIPLIYLLTQQTVQRVSGFWVGLALCLAVAIGTAFRYDQFSTQSRVGYISDEWQWYPPGSLVQSRSNGETLHKYFKGLPVRVAFWAGQAKMIYYADPAVAIEASAGLTDTAIAHQAISERGRPGHEKSAPMEYLVRKKVNFLFGPFEAPPAQPVLNMAVFDSIVARIIVYDNTVMSKLRSYPTVRFVSFPDYLDEYIAMTLPSSPHGAVAADYERFKTFYFDHNDDPKRESAFLNYLGLQQ